MNRRLAQWLPFLAAVAMVLIYWGSTHPPGVGRGYAEDFGNHEMTRQLMHEQIMEHGRPGFFSDHVMAPTGLNLAFFAGWNMERDWIGAYVWGWNRDFPFSWVHYGISLFICLLAAGLILRKMGFGPWAAWSLALVAALDNLPRHIKLWHHDDTVMLHWVYAGFFLDALIWQRLVRDRRWSIPLELWRGVLMLAVFTTMGYNWGATILEWEVLRLGIAIVIWRGKRTGQPSSQVRIEWSARQAIAPVVLGSVLLSLEIYWFLPLMREALKEGLVAQGMGYFVNLGLVVAPLWLERLTQSFGAKLPYTGFMGTETVVTLGWAYLSVFFMSLHLVRRKRGGRGFAVVAPFGALLLILIVYMTITFSAGHSPAHTIQRFVPFLKFFRTVCRVGLFLTPLFVIVWALTWPEWMTWWNTTVRGPQAKMRARAGVGIFAVIAVLELSFLLTPTAALPPINGEATRIFAAIHDLPGDTVLSFPICAYGANGVCTSQKCPRQPSEALPHSLRVFHDKKVYGAYMSRMTDATCQLYDRAPFEAWFAAWREDRCFSEDDWSSACDYLKQHGEISALLVFPGLWPGMETPKCQAELQARLGKPLGEATIMTMASRDGQGRLPTQMQWFAPKCLASVPR